MVETKFQTSFIPKQPVTGATERVRPGVGIFFLISFLLFVASVAGAIGVFVWNKTVLANIERGRVELEENKNAFDPTTIREFTDLDKRIKVASALLRSHVAVSEVFPRLAANTLKTVQFNNFSFINGGNGNILINMSGEAADYESMALQAQQFTKPELRDSFRGPIFSNFSKSGDTVVFTFSSGIDPFVIDYYQTRSAALKQGAGARPNPTPTLPVSGPTR